MAADSRGYYSALGLSPGASIDVVRAVYRQLAKGCHPDTPGCRDGGERFRHITEAYDALSDPGFKATYDLGEERAPAGQKEQTSHIDPIPCQVCGRVTAQPRRLVFWRVTSFILASTKDPVQQIYCRDCAAKEQWKSTVWTSLLGWWGIPWGPAWSIMLGVTNATGGAREPEVDEALMWQNTLAFAVRGEGQLAVGLSNILLKSENTETAQRSAEIIRFFADRGVDPATTLRDVWKRSALNTVALFATAFAVPAAAIAFVAIPTSSTHQSTSLPDVQGTEDVDILAGVFGPQAQEPPPEKRAASVPAPTCKSQPDNGEILIDRRGRLNDGHILQIENGSEGDAIVKVRDASDNRTLASFFVARGETAALRNIPDGSYFIQYAAGDKLALNCRTFVNDGTASANTFPGPETLTTRYEEVSDGMRVIRGRLTYTLYNVPNGNVHPNEISLDEFNKP
jgi:hypothetical protein